MPKQPTLPRKASLSGATAAASLPWAGSGFPPYGHISRDYRLSADHTAVPPYFRVEGRPGAIAEWQRFIDREVTTLAAWLWPRFDRATGAWVGAACASMADLTRADLALMRDLSEKLQAEATFAVPDPAGGAAKSTGLKRSHLDLFHAEDKSARPTLNVYFPDLEATQQADLDKSVADWLQGYGEPHIVFKLAFQRPRPYQMSYLLGAADDDFDYRFGASAVTPSLISGHAFSGLVVRCGALLARQINVERHLHGLRRMKQYMVDIGDRRVFAGVHYPSDNLASWWCALRLCDHYYGAAGPQAKEFMWQAISEHSAVYRAILDAAKAAGSPYAVPLAKLQAEAARPASPDAAI